PLGCDQVQALARRQDVNRADLGDHLGSNYPDNSLEPLLRRARARHYVAKAAQEAAGCADAASGLSHPRAPGSPANSSETPPVALACLRCAPRERQAPG